MATMGLWSNPAESFTCKILKSTNPISNEWMMKLAMAILIMSSSLFFLVSSERKKTCNAFKISVLFGIFSFGIFILMNSLTKMIA